MFDHLSGKYKALCLIPSTKNMIMEENTRRTGNGTKEELIDIIKSWDTVKSAIGEEKEFRLGPFPLP